MLEGASAAITADRYDAFRAGLRELGYVEQVNIRLEYRYADGFLDRLAALAAELVSLQPSVIVSAPVPANLAVSKATRTIPIVMANGRDPVGFGLAQSLSRPGGNITGLTNFSEDLDRWRKTSCSVGSTRRSSATRSADGGCRSGTMIGIIPAASAARTPGSESSSTRQEAGSAPSLRAAST